MRQIVTSKSLNKWLPLFAGLVLAAGVLTFIVVKWNNTAENINSPVSNQPAQVAPPPPPPAPFTQDARHVAARFIATAVARKNLAEAWNITGDSIKGGQSYKSWLTGDIAVVPYPASKNAGMIVKYSNKNAVELYLALAPKKGEKIKPQTFIMDLARVGAPGHKHWVVNYWAPYSVPQVPVGS